MGSWQDAEVVAVFPKKNRDGKQLVKVGISTFGGRAYTDIREVYRDEETGALRPTRKGMKLNFGSLLCLSQAVEQALKLMDEKYGGVFSDEPSLRHFLALNGGTPRACAGDQTASTCDDCARRQERERNNE